jgi:hypothetical protein
MLRYIPLTLIPLILFNILAVTYGMATPPWDNALFSIPLVRGAATITLGDLIVLVGIVTLFLEMMKAARPGSGAIADHLASTGVFIIYLIEFIIAPIAANATFLILTIMAIFDVAAGFTISLRASTRDFSLGGGHTLEGPV